MLDLILIFQRANNSSGLSNFSVVKINNTEMSNIALVR